MHSTPRSTGSGWTLFSLANLANFWLVATGAALAQGVADCSPETIGHAVPEVRVESSPGHSIHPTDLSGSVILRPAPGIDPLRDSTAWNTLSYATAMEGFELFKDVVSAGSRNGPGHNVDRWLFVAYTNGIQIWDLDVRPQSVPPRGPEYPARVEFRDLFGNQWFSKFGDGGFEVDNFLNGLDVLQRADGAYIIATAGVAPAGVSFWLFDPQAPNGRKLNQALQDFTVEGYQVRLFESSGRVYAAVATYNGTRIYDATQALAEGPCEISKLGQTCSDAIRRGKLAGSTSGRYVDVIQRNGKNYVVLGNLSRGGVLDIDAEIWELPDPSRPEPVPAGTAVRKYAGTEIANVFSPVFFSPQAGKFYLALIKRVGHGDHDLHIYDIGHCLDADGCTGLGTRQADEDLKFVLATDYYLTPSWSRGELFLHHGLNVARLQFEGSGLERLWNLSGLPKTYGRNQLPEVTDTSDSYPDPCHGKQVDYFGDYLPGNDYGLNRFSPQRARFNGPYLYRAGYTLLDIHVLGKGLVATGEPQVETRLAKDGGGSGGNEFWLDQAVELETLVSSCLAEVGAWCWLVEPDNPDLTFTPSVECDQAYSSSQAFRFGCDAATRCDDSIVGISAWNLACGAAGRDSTIEQMVGIKDPTIEIAGIETGDTSFAQCQIVPLSAQVRGRGPVDFLWQLDGESIAGCSGSVPQGSDLSAAPFTCRLDTSGVTFGPEIFLDDFESGSLGRWSQKSGSQASQAVSSSWTAGEESASKYGFLRARAGAGLAAELVLTDGGRPVDTAMVRLDVTEIGDPAFANSKSPIVAPVVDGSAATLKAPAVQTTEWTWELEDPNGGSTCTFGASRTSCEIVRTVTDSVQYAWKAKGTYRFNVRISNCRSTKDVSASGSVEVFEIPAPTVTSFALSFGTITGGSCCGNPLSGFQCVAGNEAQFTVTTAEEWPFTFGFDWELEAGETPSFTPQSPVDSIGTKRTFTYTFSTDSLGKKVYPTIRSSNGVLDSILRSSHAPIAVVSSCS